LAILPEDQWPLSPGVIFAVEVDRPSSLLGLPSILSVFVRIFFGYSPPQPTEFRMFLLTSRLGLSLPVQKSTVFTFADALLGFYP